MLEQLAKRDKEWRRLAFSICGCRSQADDLVHDMYLKLHNKKFEITTHYVYFCMKHIYLDKLRRKKTVNIEHIINLEKQYADDDTLEKRKHLAEILDTMKAAHREVLLMTSEMSLRDAANVLSEMPFGTVSYQWVNTRKKEALKILEKLLKKL